MVVVLFSFTLIPPTMNRAVFGPDFCGSRFFFAASLMLQPVSARTKTTPSAPYAYPSATPSHLLANLSPTLFLLHGTALLPVLPFVQRPGAARARPTFLVFFLAASELTCRRALPQFPRSPHAAERCSPLLLLPLLKPVLVARTQVTVGLSSEPFMEWKVSASWQF